MRRSSRTGTETQAPTSAVANASLVVSSADLLLSMVETRWVSRNGDNHKMDSGEKAQQELEKIEQQLSKLQSVPGQDDGTRREIQQLHQRIENLRKQISSQLQAWEKPSWPGIPSGLTPSITLNVFSATGAKFMGIGSSPM